MFAKAHRILRENVRDCLRQYDLAPTSWTILGAVIDSPDGIRSVTLAERLRVRSPLVTALANQLVDEGLIRRVPHHSDKRAKLLVITPAGKQKVAIVEAAIGKSLKQLLDGVSDTDLDGYRTVLEAIIRNGS